MLGPSTPASTPSASRRAPTSPFKRIPLTQDEQIEYELPADKVGATWITELLGLLEADNAEEVSFYDLVNALAAFNSVALVDHSVITKDRCQAIYDCVHVKDSRIKALVPMDRRGSDIREVQKANAKFLHHKKQLAQHLGIDFNESAASSAAASPGPSALPLSPQAGNQFLDGAEGDNAASFPHTSSHDGGNEPQDEADALSHFQIDPNENIDGKSDIMMNVTAQTSKAALQRVLEGAAAEYMDKKDGYYHARYRGHNKALGRMKAMFSSNFKKSEHQQLMNPLVGGVLPNHTLRKEAFDLIKSTDDAGAALYPKLAAAFSEVDTWVSSMMVTSGQFRAGQEDAQAFLGDLFKLNDGAMLKLMDARQNPVYDGFFKNKAKSPTKTRAAIEKIVVDVCALSDSGRPDPKSEPMKALLRTVLAPEAGTVKAPKA